MNLFERYRLKAHVPGRRERRSRSPWKTHEEPQRILTIRFHATGDVALTLPACAALRQRYPAARIDLLTSFETAPLAKAIRLFNSIHVIRRRPSKRQELSELLSLGLTLRQERYQVILDLQRNWKSRWLRRMLEPDSWGEFDRFSMRPACDRTLGVFHEAGFNSLTPVFEQSFTHGVSRTAQAMLQSSGWQPGHPLVVLNPAGLWETRNWPLDSYVKFARALRDSSGARFLLIGTGRIGLAAKFLGSQLGDMLIDLSERTSLDVAFGLLDFADLLITEDSGLMHMAWALGIPQVALFGSSRHYWSLPSGPRVLAFHSGDLPCGACMQARCRFGDNHCLTRVSPETVLRAAETLLAGRRKERNRE